jgi:hypothetical protein
VRRFADDEVKNTDALRRVHAGSLWYDVDVYVCGYLTNGKLAGTLEGEERKGASQGGTIHIQGLIHAALI